MGSMFIPKYGDIRNANDYRLQNTIFADQGKLYKYVKIAVGTYVRKYTALYVNGEGEAIIPGLPSNGIINAVAEFDIDAMGEAKWARVIWNGDAYVDVVGKEVSCVYNNTKLIPVFNAQMRSVNANITIGDMTAQYGALTSIVGFACAAGTVANNNARIVEVGDVIYANTSTPIYGVVTYSNTSVMNVICVAGLVAMTNASAQIKVINAPASALKSKIATSSANYVEYKVAVPVNSINVSSAATVFTLNAAVAGMLVKTGDRIKFSGVGMPAGADSCTLYVTGIINATAFNCNASTDVETTGAMGTIFNVCSNYFKCTVGNF